MKKGKPSNKKDSLDWYSGISSIFFSSSFLFYPLVGLLSDVWIGKSTSIAIGFRLCFIGWIVGGIGYILVYTFEWSVCFWVPFVIAYTLAAFGSSCVHANIVQYNVDQLIGASSYKLNTVIYWHCAFAPVADATLEFLICAISSDYLTLVSYIISGVAISIVLISHFYFRHNLETVSLVKNPVKLIVRVLCYARKHKYPENRSALTYWEEEAPSRLDLGKDKYGGPFTEEEVEDVKTVFRMLPLFIAIIGFSLIDNPSWDYDSNAELMSCLSETTWGFYTSISCIMAYAVYLLIVKPCCSRNTPMLVRIMIGLIFSVSVSLSKLILFSFLQFNAGLNATLFLIIPQVLVGLSWALVSPALMTFTVAQAPVHMRGVMVGLMWASQGIGLLANELLIYSFKCISHFICTNFYHSLTIGLINFFILIVFGVFAKRYKYRVRENEVNIVQIVDDHYQRYIEQEEEYKKSIQNFPVN
uniref:Major facilitator superfamily (MFS) profile domain-containing protein n=1 Tax=Amphimedon queenslandica TaxID=400682 RepID=A0A1X7VC78_AMPQE